MKRIDRGKLEDMATKEDLRAFKHSIIRWTIGALIVSKLLVYWLEKCGS
jgi:hypothetical protein